MKKLPLIIGFILLISSNAIAQHSFTKPSNELRKHLDQWYDSETGLWNTTSWWNAANIVTALIKKASLDKNEDFKKELEEIFNKTKEFEVPANDEKPAWICKNYINDYYDDEGWWALAWLDAYEFTGYQKYLDMAIIIFDDITSGWSDLGGIYWKKGLTSRNSISNGLTFSLATRLHVHKAPKSNGYTPIEWAHRIWNWYEKEQLMNSDGNIQDGVHTNNGITRISPNVWTYNQGVVLTGLMNMHKITGNNNYLVKAHQISHATLEQMTNDAHILVEKRCEPDDCNGDAKQFKGVFMRHLGVLQAYDPKESYKDFILTNAESIWENAMNKGLHPPGVSWYMQTKANAATVSSALDAINTAVALSNNR